MNCCRLGNVKALRTHFIIRSLFCQRVSLGYGGTTRYRADRDRKAIQPVYLSHIYYRNIGGC